MLNTLNKNQPICLLYCALCKPISTKINQYAYFIVHYVNWLVYNTHLICFGLTFQAFQLNELFCQPFAWSSQPSACDRSIWLSCCSWHPKDLEPVQYPFNQHSHQCHLHRWPDSFSRCCSNSQSNPERQTQWTVKWFDWCPFIYVQPLFNVGLNAYHFCQ